VKRDEGKRSGAIKAGGGVRKAKQAAAARCDYLRPCFFEPACPFCRARKRARAASTAACLFSFTTALGASFGTGVAGCFFCCDFGCERNVIQTNWRTRTRTSCCPVRRYTSTSAINFSPGSIHSRLTATQSRINPECDDMVTYESP
jgi:hypothetical protein